MNAYKVKAGIGVIAGNTVRYMPERFRGFTTRHYINPLYLYLTFTSEIRLKKTSVAAGFGRHVMPPLTSK